MSHRAPYLVLILWGLTAVPNVAEDRVARPNIVMVLADDLTAHSIGCYGNTDVHTPHIDTLSREGLRFATAYTSTAMCAPSRAQLYTGLFPVRNGAYPNHSRVREGVRSLPHYLTALGYRVALLGKRHYRPPSAFPFEELPTHGDRDATIREFVTRDRNQPFCLVYASKLPHARWTEGDATAYRPEALSLPHTLVDTPATRGALTRYYAEVTELDREVGVCDRAIRQAGLLERTLFLFSSEQGSGFPGAKWTCYEEGLRVALIIRWPGVVAPHTVTNAWVHYVDVVPTLVSAAGGIPLDSLDGRSFLAVLRGETTSHRDVIYGVHTQKGAIGSPVTGYPVRSIRVGRYKYIMNLNHTVTFSNALTTRDNEHFWKSWLAHAQTDPRAAQLVDRYIQRPAEELYDLRNDPDELHNLAADPAQRQRTQLLRGRLQAWMVEQGDHGMETELAFHQSGGKE